MKKKVYGIVLILIIVMSIFSGCTSYSYTAKGWSGNQYPGRFNATFSYFHGEKYSGISLKEGQVISIDYKSKVEEGELFIRLYDSEGKLVEELGVNAEGSKEIKAEKNEKYKLVVEGNKAKGSFDLGWKIE